MKTIAIKLSANIPQPYVNGKVRTSQSNQSVLPEVERNNENCLTVSVFAECTPEQMEFLYPLLSETLKFALQKIQSDIEMDEFDKEIQDRY